MQAIFEELQMFAFYNYIWKKVLQFRKQKIKTDEIYGRCNKIRV